MPRPLSTADTVYDSSSCGDAGPLSYLQSGAELECVVTVDNPTFRTSVTGHPEVSESGSTSRVLDTSPEAASAARLLQQISYVEHAVEKNQKNNQSQADHAQAAHAAGALLMMSASEAGLKTDSGEQNSNRDEGHSTFAGETTNGETPHEEGQEDFGDGHESGYEGGPSRESTAAPDYASHASWGAFGGDRW